MKIKLSLMMIAIVAIVAGGIAIIELQKSSSITFKGRNRHPYSSPKRLFSSKKAVCHLQ